MPSSPPPDRFQREIDDIIRLAERRLEHQSFSYRMKRSTRRLGNAISGIHLHLPAAEVLGGWALALLLLAWLMSLPFIGANPLVHTLQQYVLALGIILLVLAIVTSLMRGRNGNKMWRGEQLSYGNPYGESWLVKLRRMFRGR
jgi:hypothetical protein